VLRQQTAKALIFLCLEALPTKCGDHHAMQRRQVQVRVRDQQPKLPKREEHRLPTLLPYVCD
jgi:hypothetical protein